MKSFCAVLDALRPLNRLAAEIGESEYNVRYWQRSNNIPPRAYRLLADVATERGVAGVTVEGLLSLAEAKKRSGRAKRRRRSDRFHGPHTAAGSGLNLRRKSRKESE
jgi:hypothetical protein